MGQNTNIEWCDHTFNPWIGCQAISPGCDNCYAAAWAKRYGRDFATPTLTKAANWALPFKWARLAEHEASTWESNCKLIGRNKLIAEGFTPPRRPRVFTASLADIFDNRVNPEWREHLWAMIRATKSLDWLIVTKRIGNAIDMLPEDWGEDGYPNVWILITVCDQKEYERDILKLANTPAICKGLSIEPMLGQIDLNSNGAKYNVDLGEKALKGIRPLYGDIDWVIVGGESGKGARPMQADWARLIRDQCTEAGVPFFFKQWGHWCPAEELPDETARILDSAGHKLTDEPSWALSKRLAGRTLDGEAWNQFPEVLEHPF